MDENIGKGVVVGDDFDLTHFLNVRPRPDLLTPLHDPTVWHQMGKRREPVSKGVLGSDGPLMPISDEEVSLPVELDL